jgi:Na+-translocating ferredoxin:NAD+ oxidoreductase RnfE subunit
MILIAIGQELMETLFHAYKTNLMHILPPGLWLGVETIANKLNTSLRY